MYGNQPVYELHLSASPTYGLSQEWLLWTGSTVMLNRDSIEFSNHMVQRDVVR